MKQFANTTINGMDGNVRIPTKIDPKTGVILEMAETVADFFRAAVNLKATPTLSDTDHGLHILDAIRKATGKPMLSIEDEDYKWLIADETDPSIRVPKLEDKLANVFRFDTRVVLDVIMHPLKDKDLKAYQDTLKGGNEE